MTLILDHINAALTATGNQPITSFDDGSAEANVTKANYELMVKEALAAHPWRFARKVALLARLNIAVDLPWTAAYQRPTDCLHPRALLVSGQSIDYALMGSQFRCNATEGVTLEYTIRVGEAAWPPHFAGYVRKRLEALYLRAIAEKYTEAEAMDRAADRLLSVSKRRDSETATPSNPVRAPILQARRG